MLFEGQRHGFERQSVYNCIH